MHSSSSSLNVCKRLIRSSNCNFHTLAITLHSSSMGAFFLGKCDSASVISCLSYPVLTFLVKLVPIYFAEQGISGSWFATWKMSYGLGALLSGLLIAHLLRRYDHDNAMIVSILVMAILLLVMGSYLSPTLIILLTIVLGFFNSYNRIARTNKMHHVIAMEERGRVEGGLKLFSTLAQSLSYVVIALLSYLQLTALGFIIIGIVLLIAGVIMLHLKQRLISRCAPVTLNS